MATSITHRGWKLDKDRAYLAALFNGVEAFRITAGKLAVAQTWATAAATGRPLSSTLTTNITLGSYANAFKAYVDCSTNGRSTGLLSAGNFELLLPSGIGGSAYTCVEHEMTCPATGYAGGTLKPSFMYFNSSGATRTVFDDYGVLMHIDGGLAALTGNLIGAGYSTMRIAFGVNFATTRYIPLSTAEASYTTAYPIISSSTTGYRCTAALDPDETRTNYALAVGNRVTALDVTMDGSTNQNFDPIQLSLNVIGTAPTGTSTTNLIYAKLAHDTKDMANLRLKCADWNVSVKFDVKDAYVYQGEIVFTNACTVGGESAVLGLVMNAGASTITGNLRGAIISMQGAGTYASAVGLEIRTTCGVALGTGLSEGIRIAGTPLPVVGIAMGNQTNDNEGPQNAFFFPSIGGADEGPCVASGTGTGAITIKIGTATRYIRFFTTA